MRRFVQWLPLLILIPLWGGGLVLDRIAERALLDSVHERMVTALHAHREHVLAVLAHQQRGLRLFAAGAAASLAGAPTGRKVPVLHGPFLASLMPEAIGCLLFGAKGQMVAHTGEKAPSFEIHVPAGLTETRFSDPSVDADGRSFYDVILPLRSDSRQVGTLACRSKNILSQSLAEHRQGLGLSGETYLVSAKTHLMLTESRFIPNAIGRVKVDTIGMREALKMRNGIAPYPDYRGIPVVGAFLYLRDYDWVLLAEMDEAEALAPMFRLRMAVGLSLGLISVAAGAVGWRYGRRLSEAYAQTEEARDQAQQGEAQVKALLRSMADAVFEIDESSTILIANESAHRMFGWPSGELVGQKVTVLMSPEDGIRHETGLRRYLETGESRIVGKVVEVTGRRRDGSPFPCELSVAVVLLPDGTRRFIGVHRDVTERKQAHQALKASEEKHRSLFENMLEGFAHCRMLYDHGKPEDFIYLDVNSAFERLTGLKNVVGRRVTEVIPNIRQTNPELFEIYGRVASTGTPERFETYLKPLAAWFSISVYSTQTEHFIAMFDNITERKLAEADLHAAAAYARSLVEASLDPLLTINPDGKITDVNKASEAITGLPREHLIGSDFSEYCTEPEKARTGYRQALGQGAVRDYPLTVRHASGHLTDVLYNATVYCNEYGVVQGVLATAWDITEHKLMQKQASRMEHLAALGQLLGGIAHELKNPLFVVTGRTQLLKEMLANREYDAVAKNLQIIEEAGKRMTAITQRFLTLARPVKPHLQQCSMHAIVDQALDFLSNELMKNRIRVVRAFAPNVPRTWSEPRQLHEVFLNLMLNAMQAMVAAHGQGTLTITTLRKDDWIEARIQDDGPGIPPHHHAKLFEPFFSTKPPEQGTGLGLWTVRSTLAEIKGTVKCESVEGQGATFIVRIPIATAPPKE